MVNEELLEANAENIEKAFFQIVNNATQGLISKAYNIRLPFSALETSQETKLLNNIEAQPIDYDYLSDLLERNSTHKFCLLLKTNLTVGLGYYFMQNNVKKEVNSKLKSFLKTPNSNFGETFSKIMYKLCLDWYLYGRFALEIIKADGKIAVYHAPAKDVYVENKGNKITGYYQIVDGKIMDGRFYKKYSPNNKTTMYQMLVVDKYNPKNSFYGVPEYLPALKAIVMNDILAQFFLNFFDNSARPDFLLALIGEKISDTNLNTLSNSFTNFKGVENAGKAGILNIQNERGDAKILTISTPINDSFRNTKSDNRDEIAQMHGVPPKVIGVTSAGSMGSSNETIGALKILKEAIILPEQELFENVFSLFFEAEFGEEIQLKLNSIRLESAKDLAIITKTQLDAGMISINEAREENGFDKHADKKYNELGVVETKPTGDLQINDNDAGNLDPTKGGEDETQFNK